VKKKLTHFKSRKKNKAETIVTTEKAIEEVMNPDRGLELLLTKMKLIKIMHITADNCIRYS
jgi:hypothetical protein